MASGPSSSISGTGSTLCRCPESRGQALCPALSVDHGVRREAASAGSQDCGQQPVKASGGLAGVKHQLPVELTKPQRA